VETPFHWWTHAWDVVTGEEVRCVTASVFLKKLCGAVFQQKCLSPVLFVACVACAV
jgi:hypothetical protein